MASYESGYDPKYGYNRNAFAHKTIVTSILGRTVKLIAAPIGLVSEAVHHHKEKRRTDSQSEDQLGKKPAAEHTPKDSGESTSPVLVHVPAEQAEELIAKHEAVLADGESSTHDLMPVESTEDDGIDKDEADWALDDAAHEIEGDEQEEHLLQKAIVPKTSSIITSKKHNSRSLPFPVIIPQRRPGTKTRGFVRAYAPILEDAGIDQHMFLTFLKDFHKAAQASPVFDVIIVTTAIAGFYPDPIAGIAIQAVQIAAAIGQEVQERWRLNKFLDQANRDIFIPRGVYALIVTYVPGGSGDGEIGTQTIDIGASAYVKYGGAVTPAEDASGAEIEENRVHKIDEIKEKMKRLRVASGQTHGEAELPATCAPLIFPTLDTAARKDTRESVGDEIKAKSKSTSKFVQAYFDRRAQASYAYANPNSTLTSSMGAASPQFKSRYADPNNATNTHFFTLLTGGRYKAEPLGARRRYEKAQRKAEERRLQGLKEKSTSSRRRLLQEGILYLTIVNMPTEQELEKARMEIQAAKVRRKAKAREYYENVKAGGFHPRTL